MRRHLVIAACVTLVAGHQAAVRADDADKAKADYDAITAWLEGQNTKSKGAEERKAVFSELAKKLRTFLKDHPNAGRPTSSAKSVLADVLVDQKKIDEALALYEDLLKTGDEEHRPRARWGVVRSLVAKKDLKGARARLDAFQKDHPDEKTLAELDDYLKKIEEKPPVLKVGATPPAFAVKTFDEKDLQLADLKGKVVLVDFWATWCPPCMKDLPALKKLHAELKEKLEIVGVDCFEKDWDAYKTFLEKQQLGWPQVWKTDAKKLARDYGVVELPRNVLIGRSGEILAMDRHGDDLVNVVRAAVEGKPIPAKPKDKPVEKGPEKKPALEPGDTPKGEE